MKKSWVNFGTVAFVIWLIVIFLTLVFAVVLVGSQDNFLGGGSQNYSKTPLLFAFGNFDGEHYVSISRNGYGHGERAFFPLYPLLIRSFSNLFNLSLQATYAVGVLISLTAFYFAIQGFYKLVRLDYPERVARLSLIFLLLFPTSFYFAAVYTESLFLCLLVWSVYYLRSGKIWLAVVLGIFLTATRFVGILILPVFLIELFSKNKKPLPMKHFVGPALLPMGLVSYMVYLKLTVSDYFAFYTNLATFGEQRSSHPILLPQVFYRYIFKILPGMNTDYFPVIFTTWFEFVIGLVYLPVSLFIFFKTRLSYAVIIFFGYVVPTLSGSFSSLPRYVLVLFPFYIVLAEYLSKRRKLAFAFSLISFILLIISWTLFARGYWVS